VIITDTPRSSFDKVIMDIVGSFPKPREKTNILTLQDQLIKFCMGIPLPDQTIEIAKAEDLLIDSSIYWEHQKQY